MRFADLHNHTPFGAYGPGDRLHSPILSRCYRDTARKYGDAHVGAVFAEDTRLLPEGEDREGAMNHE